jgi:hypothetical protein
MPLPNNPGRYFESAGDGDVGKKLKGTIDLIKTEKIEIKDPKLLIHTAGRLWDLTAEAPGQADAWGDMLSTFIDVPIIGRKVQSSSMADMMDSLGPAKKQGEAVSLFADRIDVRAVTLQRLSKEAKYGVQFAPYEGTANGVMICGVTVGGPGDGVVVVREKVVGINGKSCDGLTYPEAVQLMRTVVDGTWSVLNLDVEFREIHGIVSTEYEPTQPTELALKV